MNGLGSILRDYLEYHKISQTDFADRLGISQKHMNEIINGKTNLSVELILAISLLTDIDANLIYFIENKKKTHDMLIDKYKTEKEINKLLSSYYIKEMNDRNWIKLKDKNNFTQNYLDLIEYAGVKDLDTLDNYLDKRYLFKKKHDADNRKIYLWIRHCDYMIKNITIDDYDHTKLNDLFKELKIESNKPFDLDSIVKLLRKYGIVLYVEDALKGTKIRGCIKVMVDRPVIYLTKYYKEKSSFYFTLYHELIHLKKDYNMLKNKTIIKDDDEDDIDKLALNEMIDENIYQSILSNYDRRDIIAKDNDIPLTFLYTRLAKEGRISYNSKEYLDNVERIG